MKQVVPIEVRGKRNHIKYLDSLRPISRVNRQQMTSVELKLWLTILKSKQTGYRFFRQKPLGKFIADFYCSKLALIIEVDGSSHTNRQSIDQSRDQYFQERGILTVRFTNNEIISELLKVKNKLEEIINKRKSELGI